jgi:predicted DCC family thiol-disulfide oxidoreductase YuxK
MQRQTGRPAISIVFYDGYCGLCSRTVKFLLAKDNKKDLYFAPLEGKTFDNLVLSGQISHKNNSVIFYHGGLAFYESDATLTIMSVLPAPWKFFSLLKFIPKSIRNFAYRFIAKNRTLWFGKHEKCYTVNGTDADRVLP